MLELASTNTKNSLSSFPEKTRDFFLQGIRKLIHAYGRGASHENNEAVTALDRHIKSGLALIREGDAQQATQIYTDIERSRSLGIKLDIINCMPHMLRTPDDVARAARRATVGSEQYGGGDVRIPVAAPSPSIRVEGSSITYTKFDEFPDRYSAEAVRAYQQELAILQAEELGHELQDRSGGSIAGQGDREADVAAYLYQQGTPLTREYLTRYQSRMDWYLQIHPERTAELQTFRDAWGGM